MADLDIKNLLSTRNLPPNNQKILLKNNDINDITDKVEAFFVKNITEKPLFLNGCISCGAR